MKKIISCCGVVCSECEYFPTECEGCPAQKGNVFWLANVEADICPIYKCCINEKQIVHCGLCEKLPCERYLGGDPTKTEEENAEVLKKQLEQLGMM